MEKNQSTHHKTNWISHLEGHNSDIHRTRQAFSAHIQCNHIVSFIKYVRLYLAANLVPEQNTMSIKYKGNFFYD